MWQEYGFASINRDTNEENLFYNPGNVAGGTPFWCTWHASTDASLAPDEDAPLMLAAHKAWGTYWASGSGNNQTSSGGVQMIATDCMFAWNWDARPFPTFPLRLDVWADGSNWRAGMWLAGKGFPPTPPQPDTPPGPGTYATFPTLIGQAWSVKYSPRFSTRVASHVSGRETRAAAMTSPLYDIELSFDLLRSGAAYGELQTVLAFLLSHAGRASPFLLPPPGGLGVFTGAALGVGDGATKAFALKRTVGTFTETVQALTASPTIYQNGVAQSAATYSVSILPATITFATAPAAGVVLTADFSAAHLARLTNDAEDLEQFMSGLWNKQALKLETVRG
jgi:uncharacterized protein (TIGR02217 family)